MLTSDERFLLEQLVSAVEDVALAMTLVSDAAAAEHLPTSTRVREVDSILQANAILRRGVTTQMRAREQRLHPYTQPQAASPRPDERAADPLETTVPNSQQTQ
jgi:hypothetical protein